MIYSGKSDHRQFNWRADRIRADKDIWIETSLLLNAIRCNSSSPVPEEVLEYMRRRLEGEVPRPRGRPSRDDVGFIRNELFSRSSLHLARSIAIVDNKPTRTL